MPTDWKTGEALWLIDFVAPFGGQEKMVEELRRKILPGQRMKMLQAKPEGGGWWSGRVVSAIVHFVLIGRWDLVSQL